MVRLRVWSAGKKSPRFDFTHTRIMEKGGRSERDVCALWGLHAVHGQGAAWDQSAQKAEGEFPDAVVTRNRYHGNDETHCNPQTSYSKHDFCLDGCKGYYLLLS